LLTLTISNDRLNHIQSHFSIEVRHIGGDFFSYIQVFCFFGTVCCFKHSRNITVSKLIMEFEEVFMLLKFSVQYSSKVFISFQFSLLFLCCFGSGYRNLGSVIILASYFSKVFMRLVSFIFIFGWLLRLNQALLLKEVLKII
jgi:hypothetical protein